MPHAAAPSRTREFLRWVLVVLVPYGLFLALFRRALGFGQSESTLFAIGSVVVLLLIVYAAFPTARASIFGAEPTSAPGPTTNERPSA